MAFLFISTIYHELYSIYLSKPKIKQSEVSYKSMGEVENILKEEVIKSKVAISISFLSAIFFSIHPIHTEPINNLGDRK